MKNKSLSILLLLAVWFACSNRAERDRALQDLERKQQELQQNKEELEQLVNS